MSKRIIFVAIGLLGAAAVGQAATLFDTGTGPSLTSRTSTLGPGQGVSVSVNTTLTQFGFYLDTPSGGNLKFMIWDGTNTTLLYSETDAAATTSSPALVLTKVLSFSLLSGNTYYFAVIPDTAANIEYFSLTSLSQNGLSLVNPNTNYGPFSSPVFVNSAAATIALQIDGSQAPSVPEPATWFSSVLGLGLLIMFGKILNRARSKKSASAA
jgi:hypothetical protein